jgi:hypothetical protein
MNNIFIQYFSDDGEDRSKRLGLGLGLGLGFPLLVILIVLSGYWRIQRKRFTHIERKDAGVGSIIKTSREEKEYEGE